MARRPPGLTRAAVAVAIAATLLVGCTQASPSPTASASGYVLKRIGSNELVDAVRNVAAGRSMLDPSVTAQVLDRLRSATHAEEEQAFADLTDQERRVLAHVARGSTNREIAAAMDLAEKTVRNYVSNILAKLSLASRAQATAYAIRNRLSELSDDRG